MAVMRSFVRPMTLGEVWRRAVVFSPRMQERDALSVLKQLMTNKLAACLTPDLKSSKVYALTKQGCRVAEKACNLKTSAQYCSASSYPAALWESYSKVAIARVRREVLLELARQSQSSTNGHNGDGGISAEALRQVLRNRQSIKLGNMIRILSDLQAAGLVSFSANGRKRYRLTSVGEKVSAILDC